MIATPIYSKNDVMVGFLGGEIGINVLNEVLSSAFGNKTNTYLVSNIGTIIAGTNNKYTLLNDNNVFNIWDGSKFLQGHTLDEIRSNLKNNKEGSFNIDSDGNKRYIAYKPVNINNWNLVLSVPDEVISEMSSTILIGTNIISIIIILTAASLLWLMYTQQKKYNENLENIVYVDSLTGSNSLEKFKVLLNELMHSNNDKVRITIIDINKFRLINNTYGMEEGNYLLRVVIKAIEGLLEKGEFCARGADDRFYIALIYQKDYLQDVMNRGNALRNSINKLLAEDGRNYKIICTSGNYIICGDESVDECIQRANLALKKAKLDGIDKVIFTKEDAIKKQIDERTMQENIFAAFEKKEFKVFYNLKSIYILIKLMEQRRYADG